MQPDSFDMSTGRLSLGLAQQGLERFGLDGGSWLHASELSGLFAVHVDGQRYSGAQLVFEKTDFDAPVVGVNQAVFHFRGPGFGVDQHVKVYEGSSLLEMWPVIRCTGEKTCQVTRVDSFSLAISPAAYEVLHFSGDWGREFEPTQTSLEIGRAHV